jgi:hypothetical protein
LAKGSHIPTIGSVRVSFQTPQLASTATKTDPSSPIAAPETKMIDDSTSPAREPSPPRDEEANSGWGADDDGMGMF